MKKKVLAMAMMLIVHQTAEAAANLIAVYNQALISDPTYQQAIAQRLSTNEGVPISRSALFPAASITGLPTLTRTTASGSAQSYNAGSTRGYTVTLNVSQTIFNFAEWTALVGAKETAKQADATLNASLQNLMIRVAQAYFAILEDEDNVQSSLSTKVSYTKQLDQVKQEFNVGVKTITDVYTAQASYDSSVANYITALNTLANDKENLRAITGIYYDKLAKLSEQFPLISPNPKNPDLWEQTALKQNWSVIAARYGMEAARENIKQQFAGHLPTVNLQGSYETDVIRNSGGNAVVGNVGTNQTHTSTIGLQLNVPLIAGGLVIAQTHQAQYDFQSAAQALEKQMRSTITNTRQSYLDVIADISKIKADRQAIQSAQSSLEGLREGYRVGTNTLLDVLNQQQTLYTNETQYATDRYDYVNKLLALKQAAGTLSPHDLEVINQWLYQG